MSRKLLKDLKRCDEDFLSLCNYFYGNDTALSLTLSYKRSIKYSKFGIDDVANSKEKPECKWTLIDTKNLNNLNWNTIINGKNAVVDDSTVLGPIKGLCEVHDKDHVVVNIKTDRFHIPKSYAKSYDDDAVMFKISKNNVTQFKE
jgi:hypothetical protein